MKRLGILVAALALAAGSYLLGTLNAERVISAPPAEWAEGDPAATAWRELVVSMEAAGQQVFEATDAPRERIEGLAFLTQLLSAALEMKVSKGSVESPQFTNWMSDYRKFLGDSPDAVYHTAEISADHRYQIRGNREDAEYLGFMLYGRTLNGWNRAAGNISSETITFDEDGDFRILLSREQPPPDAPGDWLPLEDDVHLVMVRQYFHGRSTQTEAVFDIANLDPGPLPEPGEADLTASLREATDFFDGTLRGALALSRMLATQPNSAEPPRGYDADFGGIFYPTHDNQYLGTWFRLGDDEALVIEGAAPDVAYWSVSLQNRWMQSLDYDRYQVSLHNGQIVQRDGRYRVVVSASDPGVDNWLDTAGHREGLLSIRYQLAQDFEPPSIRLVKAGALTKHPGD